MNVSIGKRWEGFVDGMLKDGRYGSASEIMREGLRLVEEREARLAMLRQTIASAIAGGGEHDDDEVGAAIDAALTARKQATPAS